MDKEAEKITIVEGPTPTFEQTPETWLPSPNPRLSAVTTGAVAPQ